MALGSLDHLEVINTRALEVSSLNVLQLKERLKQRGLSLSGLKSQLADRLSLALLNDVQSNLAHRSSEDTPVNFSPLGLSSHTLGVQIPHPSLLSSNIALSEPILLLSGSQDKTVKLWDAYTGALRHTLVGHTATVSGVCWSSDGNEIISRSLEDGTTKVWDWRTGCLLRSLAL